MKNVGSALTNWREQWQDRLARNPDPELILPEAVMAPLGYIVVQHGIRENKPVKSYSRWTAKIPSVYSESVLGEGPTSITLDNDTNCLALLEHYQSLMPMEAQKPIFFLKPADGAIGDHFLAVKEVYRDFKKLCERIIART